MNRHFDVPTYNVCEVYYVCTALVQDLHGTRLESRTAFYFAIECNAIDALVYNVHTGFNACEILPARK